MNTPTDMIEAPCSPHSGNGKRRTLYAYADETGNFTFTPNESKYFGMAAYLTADPLSGATAIHKILYELQSKGVVRQGNTKKTGLGKGEPYATLHATYDHPAVRASVFAAIEQLAPKCLAYYAYLEKRKMNPSIRSRERTYGITAGAVAKWVANVALQKGFDHVVFAFDRVLQGNELKAFKAAVKPQLASIGIPYALMFHALGHEPNGQIADYIAWAHSRSFEKQDDAPLKAMPTMVKNTTTFDLFRRGSSYYY